MISPITALIAKSARWALQKSFETYHDDPYHVDNKDELDWKTVNGIDFETHITKFVDGRTGANRKGDEYYWHIDLKSPRLGDFAITLFGQAHKKKLTVPSETLLRKFVGNLIQPIYADPAFGGDAGILKNLLDLWKQVFFIAYKIITDPVIPIPTEKTAKAIGLGSIRDMLVRGRYEDTYEMFYKKLVSDGEIQTTNTWAYTREYVIYVFDQFEIPKRPLISVEGIPKGHRDATRYKLSLDRSEFTKVITNTMWPLIEEMRKTFVEEMRRVIAEDIGQELDYTDKPGLQDLWREATT
jgi:hypothetical protein